MVGSFFDNAVHFVQSLQSFVSHDDHSCQCLLVANVGKTQTPGVILLSLEFTTESESMLRSTACFLLRRLLMPAKRPA